MSIIQRRLHRRFERGVRYLDQRAGGAPAFKWFLRYVFPDHWSFLLGEIALYSFIVLIGTGIFLTIFYVNSPNYVVYHGSYALLRNQEMSEAYRSVLRISFDVQGGLLIRQTHHWAANVFVASIVLHLARIFFTGAYRKPRDLNWYIGLTMLMLAILEGFCGYSLIDDLLSGMGIVIAYGVVLSIPGIGGQLATSIWGGQFPGTNSFFDRLEIVHILLIPGALAVLITLHIGMIMRQHHSQFPGPGRKERNTVGTPTWPAYTLRSVGLMLTVSGVLFLLGGLVQINPIWQWGPYHTYLSENGAQPDWYIGWLIGALRLMPNWEPVIGHYTIIPNPFWGGAFFPLVVFGIMYAWPAMERKVTGDRRRHDLLDRPRDRPQRTALGAGFFSWVFIIFAAGSTDRVFFRLHIPYTGMIHFWRVGVWIFPMIVYVITYFAARGLKRSEAHPLRGWQGEIVSQDADGAHRVVAGDDNATISLPPPAGTVSGHDYPEQKPSE